MRDVSFSPLPHFFLLKYQFLKLSCTANNNNWPNFFSEIHSLEYAFLRKLIFCAKSYFCYPKMLKNSKRAIFWQFCHSYT